MNVESKSSYRWILLSLLWLVYISFGLMMTALSVIVAPVMLDLKLSYSQMGFVLGSWNLVYIAFSLPIGMFIDRVGPYKSLLLASSIIALSGVLRSFAVSFETLSVFVSLFGIGGSMLAISVPKIASMWFIGSERGTAAGIYGTGATIGSVVASMTNSIIPIVGSWRSALLIYGLVGFIMAIVWLVIGRRSSSSSNSTKSTVASVEQSGKNNLKRVFKSRNVWLIVTVGVTYFLSSHAVASWLPTILQLKGMSATEAGTANSMMLFLGLFWSLLVPRLPYLLGSKKVGISLVLFIQGIVILALGIVEGPFLWLVLALSGVSHGLLNLLMVTFMDLPEVGPERMGVVGGLFFTIGEIGGFSGSFSMGLIKDLTGGFLPGLFFVTIVCEAAIVLIFLLKIK